MIVDKRVPLSYIIGKIKYELIYITLIGVLVQAITTYYLEYLPEMPLSIAAFLGTSISVILSFKLSQSYDRWWEARKVWGAIVNDSRSLIIQWQYLLNADPEQLKKTAYRQIGWCYCLGASLRRLEPLEAAKEFLSEEELIAISTHTNKPLALLQLHSKQLNDDTEKNHADPFSKIQIDETLVKLCDSMGKAERINSTVFPTTYRIFLHFIIYLFVITLSIALRDVSTLFELPLLVLISSSFFLLEKSAYHLQDPFRNRPSDTPVTTIARTIEINLKQMIGDKNVPEPIVSDDFYVL